MKRSSAVLLNLPPDFESCPSLDLFDIEIDPLGILYAGGEFGNPNECWPGGAKRVNVDTGERLADINTLIEPVPVRFRFQRPDGPSIDDEGNIYFNTFGCKDFNFMVSCGVWKLEKGEGSAFLAVNSFREEDPLDPYTAPFDPDEDTPLIREGKGTTFLRRGPFAGNLLVTAESLSSGLFEGIYIAEAEDAVFGNPIDPLPFINRSSMKTPEIFDVAEDSLGNIFISAAGGGNEIRKYDPSGNFIGVFKTLSTGPRYMAFDLDDNLYVTLSSVVPNVLVNILKIKPDGTVENFGLVPTANGIAAE